MLLWWYTIATKSVHKHYCGDVIHTLLTRGSPTFIGSNKLPSHFFVSVIVEAVLHKLPHLLILLPGHLLGCVQSYIIFHSIILHDFVPLKIRHYQGAFQSTTTLSLNKWILERRDSSQPFLGLLLFTWARVYVIVHGSRTYILFYSGLFPIQRSGASSQIYRNSHLLCQLRLDFHFLRFVDTFLYRYI